MEKETTILQFRWVKEYPSYENLFLDLKCTIPLNVGDKYIYKDENGKSIHLVVNERMYIQDKYTSILCIFFKENNFKNK